MNSLATRENFVKEKYGGKEILNTGLPSSLDK